ncbi:MAG: hypothetical protein ABWY05_00765 [Noviherbaspirillum sp.]
MSDAAGRSCPASYGYGPAVFRRAPDFAADALYVIGGLYGNPQALDRIERIARQEPGAVLVFNGDFHWFDTDPAVFDDINRRVLRHIALRGNVETELAAADAGFGCGCGYPDDVADADVERSNRILARLRETARIQPLQRAMLGGLPMHALALVGGARVGIVHGDAQALAGWRFAHDSLDDPAARTDLLGQFGAANVDLFASSHTCLPVMRRFEREGRTHAVINNGAAGMPNFHDTGHGLVSRIATTPAPQGLPVLHQDAWQVGGRMLHVAAVAVEYDQAGWRERFLADWPQGTAAHASYFERIEHGPRFTMQQAYGR